MTATLSKKKVTGLYTALRDYNSWRKSGYGRVAKIMLDKSTGETWADCFIDCNTWKEYCSPDIISLSSYAGMWTDERFTVELLRKYAEMAMEE